MQSGMCLEDAEPGGDDISMGTVTLIISAHTGARTKK